MLYGKPSTAIGIYKEGIELRVDLSRHQVPNESTTSTIVYVETSWQGNAEDAEEC
jgi:hypothetical protein